VYDELRAHLAAANAEVHALCSGKRRWTMSIPAEVDRDSDLVIGRALNEAEREIDRLTAALTVERIATALWWVGTGDGIDAVQTWCLTPREFAIILRAALLPACLSFSKE
jgi:hypothetical protein